MKFTVPLTPQKVTEKKSVTFECEVSKPNKKVTWLRAGKEIKPNKEVEITAEGTVHRLTIKAAKKEDAVEYTAKLPSDKTSAKLTLEGRKCQKLLSSFWFLISKYELLCVRSFIIRIIIVTLHYCS